MAEPGRTPWPLAPSSETARPQAGVHGVPGQPATPGPQALLEKHLWRPGGSRGPLEDDTGCGPSTREQPRGPGPAHSHVARAPPGWALAVGPPRNPPPGHSHFLPTELQREAPAFTNTQCRKLPRSTGDCPSRRQKRRSGSQRGDTRHTRTPMSWRGPDGVARPVVPRAPEAWAPAPCGSIRLPTGPQMPRPPGPGLRAGGPRPGRDVAPHVAELPADGGAHSGQGRGRLLARLGERLLSPLVAGEKKHPSDQPRGRAGHRPQSQDTVPKVRLPGHRGRVCAQAAGPQVNRGCALRLWPPNPAMTASWPHCDPSSPSATPTSGQRTAKARLGPQEAPLHPPGAKEPPGIHSAPAPPGVPLRHRACSPGCATLSRRPRGPADLHLAPPLSVPRASRLTARTTCCMSFAPATRPHTRHTGQGSVGQAGCTGHTDGKGTPGTKRAVLRVTPRAASHTKAFLGCM